ncbi:MAG TPA: ATP-dependent Clp protease proteolytic subunit [Candidatus Paceibacterota bacterium]|nr:ATP-dependent Clp protease proteolytic subunit [Candidatus Paceibacterota bacterium]
MKNYVWGAKKDAEGSNDSTAPQKTESNHIYFYADVEHKSCLELNKVLQEKSDELLALCAKNDLGKPKIYLHINSYGGSIFAGISSMDTILRLREKVDIITIVEGGVASAGTFLSVVGTKRWMTKNSFMLIHQLSSATWGKYKELKDDIENCDRLMDMIKSVYGKYTGVPKEELDKILEHDLWWTSDKCLEMKLIDKLI